MTATAVRNETWTHRAARDATRAPSVHNTQPWTIGLRPDGLDLHGDRLRKLPVLDPSGREYWLSLGAALFNARVSSAASEVAVTVTRHPDPDDVEFVATLRRADRPLDDDEKRIATLEPYLVERHSNRRAFFPEPVAIEVVDALVRAAAAEDSLLTVVGSEEHRDIVAALVQRADREQNANPAYRAELRQWTRHDPASRDGISQLVVPHVDGATQDEIPIRDFDSYGLGWLPSRTESGRHQCLLVLSTTSDDVEGWLRAGEALERVLLEVTREGYASSLFSQPIEVPAVRNELREALGLVTHPHLLLRIGRASATPGTLRRPLAEVTFDAGSG